MATQYQQSGTKYNLATVSVDIEDTSYRSENYFNVKNLSEIFSAGKNFFTINGTGNLKKNTQIYLEILDSKNNPLYYEVGKFGNYVYTNTDDLIIAPYVYKDSTEWGNGKIYLVGTTIAGKTVRWSTTIKIDPNLENFSSVVFYETPTLDTSETITPFLNESITANQIPQTISGSVIGYSIYPPLYSRFLGIDATKAERFDYRIKYTSSFYIPSQDDLNAFTSKNLDTPVDLYISRISYLSGDSVITSSVSLTQSYFISNVINNYEISLNKPFVYTVNGIPQVCSIESAQFNNTFVNLPYITASIFVSQSIQYPDGQYNPDIFRYQSSGSEATKIFLKRGNLNLILRDINTLTGNVYRYKAYKKNLNEYSDFSLAADGIIGGPELLYDEFSINNFYKNIGEFYNTFHIQNYLYTSSNNLTLRHDSATALNTLIVSSSVCTGSYIIVKGYTSLVTKQSGSKYVGYDSNQQINKQGAAYDSNFIELYRGVNYNFGCDLTLVDNHTGSSGENLEGKLEFYLTGSYNVDDFRHIGDTNYVTGYGLKIAEYTLPANQKNKWFDKKSTFTLFSVANDYKGTIVVVPTNLKSFKISNLSMRPHFEFGYSPDISIVKIPYEVNIRNEAQQFSVELFDYNLNSTGKTLTKIVNLDKDGRTLSRVGDTILFETDPVFGASEASLFQVGDKDRLDNALSSGSNISLLVNDVGYLTVATTSSVVSSSYAKTASYSSNYLALNQSIPQTVMGIPNLTSSNAVTSSYAITASYLYRRKWGEL